MKAGGAKRKGNNYERECCRELSLWVSHGEDDDLYYRTDSSGGRATARKKQGKTTSGQCGDVSLRKPLGKPLLDLCTIELKTGYPKDTPFDLIDRLRFGNHMYGQFFEQACNERSDADRPYWLVIARRKGHKKMTYMPLEFYKALRKAGAGIADATPQIRIRFANPNIWSLDVFGTPLDEFLTSVKPEDIIKLNKMIEEKG